jgi:hypothetical protein
MVLCTKIRPSKSKRNLLIYIRIYIYIPACHTKLEVVVEEVVVCGRETRVYVCVNLLVFLLQKFSRYIFVLESLIFVHGT